MRINTNIASLNAQSNNTNTNQKLQESLEKLSSGLRINKAADDASGMAIADKLRTQASSIGQGIANANSGSALIQIADAAMGEQSNILDTVKTKLLQAATSTTSPEGREAVRKDIQKLLQQLDNISTQTTYNGVNLLDQKGTDFNFQIGEKSTDIVGMTTAYSVNTKGLGSAGNEGTTQATLKATASSSGFVMEGEVANVKATMTSTAGSVNITSLSGNSDATLNISAANVSGFSAASGTITLVTDDTDTIAFLNKEATLNSADGLTKIADGQYQLAASNHTFANNALFNFEDLKITSINGGENIAIKTTDKVSIEKTGGTLDLAVTGGLTYTVDGDTAEGISMTASNSVLLQTGTAAISADDAAVNKYVALNNVDATTVSASGELSFTIGSESIVKSITLTNSASGSVTLSTTDGTTAQALRDAGLTQNGDSTFTLSVTSSGSNELNFGAEGINISNLSFTNVTRTTATGAQDAIYIETTGAITVENNKRDNINIDAVNVSLSVSATNSAGSSATAGFSASEVSSGLGSSNLSGLLSLGEGDLTSETANNFISVIDDAMTQLNSVRSDFGSTQNQLAVATRNMMTTQVNIKAAESIIRDVDYAAESVNFNKQNIISQAGTYAMSQANQVQQNILRLLQ